MYLGVFLSFYVTVTHEMVTSVPLYRHQRIGFIEMNEEAVFLDAVLMSI